MVLDRQESVLKIEGRSYPEEGMDFFEPIIVRLRTLQNTESPISTVHVRLEYYNSATAKALAEIFTSLMTLKTKGVPTKVIWEFEEEDEGIQEDVEMFMDTFNLEFDIRHTLFK